MKPKRKIKRLPVVDPLLRERARELRRNQTDAERKLWKHIRSHQLGKRFLRQRVIGRYICDFVSLEYGIVIELDGGQHFSNEGKSKDRIRDEYLIGLGFRVFRFSNADVIGNIDGVMQVLMMAVEATPP